MPLCDEIFVDEETLDVSVCAQDWFLSIASCFLITAGTFVHIVSQQRKKWKQAQMNMSFSQPLVNLEESTMREPAISPMISLGWAVLWATAGCYAALLSLACVSYVTDHKPGEGVHILVGIAAHGMDCV